MYLSIRVIGFLYNVRLCTDKWYVNVRLRLTIIAYLCTMTKEKLQQRITDLEVELIKSEAELQGYKEGEKAKSGTDYTKYIVMGIAAVEGLVIILERIV